MQQRKIGSTPVGAIGLGCMSLSHAYGSPPSSEDGTRLLHRALELGVTHFDTAALYGFGKNEQLLGKALKGHRDQIFLASKCGLAGINGKRVLDGRPETLAKTVEQSLQNLQTDHIDLYYLHRWDKNIPIEESVGAMSRMVEEGKVGAIGLSEVSAATLRKAHMVHPISAVQTEYSLWTRNVEIAVLEACRELGCALVAFSPLTRGFLCGGVISPQILVESDLRRHMPRFQEPCFSQNLHLVQSFKESATKANCTPAQLALSWLMTQGENVIPIPGTTSIQHLEENLAAANTVVDAELIKAAGNLVNHNTVMGARYAVATQAEIDTEQFIDE